ncbi:MAG TPA: hypothetical protein VD837_15550, partial [Terriglobales bacterium]|nr:hypothetical protein [Terriglobales bacterium]
GALAEVTPVTTKALGAPFGAAVWLGADEIAMPAAGLSQRPTREPFVSHVRALGAHLVYGVATELSRRALLRVMVRSNIRKAPSSLSRGWEARGYAAS